MVIFFIRIFTRATVPRDPLEEITGDPHARRFCTDATLERFTRHIAIDPKHNVSQNQPGGTRAAANHGNLSFVFHFFFLC